MARAKGSGTLVKRGKYWTARWVVDGKIYVRSTKCTNRREAEYVMKDFLRPYQAKTDIEKVKALQARIDTLEIEAAKADKNEAVSVRFMVDVMEKDINQTKMSDNTVASYDSIVNALTKFFPEKRYAYEISIDDANKFMASQKESLSEGSYNVRLNHVKHMWNVIMRHDGNVRVNPFDGIQKIKGAMISHRRELTENEIDRLLEAADKKDKELGLLYRIAIHSGLRKGDCRTLKWEEVDLNARMIRRLPTKTKRTGKIAHIPIDDELHRALSAANKDGEYVLPRLAAKNQQAAYCEIDKVFRDAGIETTVKGEDGREKVVTGFHALRHTFASRLHRSTIPIGHIQEMLGHSSVDMSMHYAHTIESDLKMPDFSGKYVKVQVENTLYERVMAYGEKDFNVTLKKLLEGNALARTNKAEEEERKRKEREEIGKLLDDVL